MACLIEVTGQQLKDALEMASKNYPQESVGFLQVSGVTYTIDSSVPSSVKLMTREISWYPRVPRDGYCGKWRTA